MTPDAIASDGLPILEHMPRRGCGLQGAFLLDWQHDQGAAMDAPAWHPLGATQARRMDWEGCANPWHLRSGHTSAPPAPPTVRVLPVELRGARYLVRLEPIDRDTPAERFLHPVDVRELATGRKVPRRSRLRAEVESLARTENLRAY